MVIKMEIKTSHRRENKRHRGKNTYTRDWGNNNTGRSKRTSYMGISRTGTDDKITIIIMLKGKKWNMCSVLETIKQTNKKRKPCHSRKHKRFSVEKYKT